MLDSHQKTKVREAAARDWKVNHSLQAEFGGSLEAFQAYRVAVSSGLVRVAPATVQHFENQPHATHTATARVDTAGKPSVNIITGRAIARDDAEAIKSIVREFQQTHRPGSYRLDEVAGFIADRAGITKAQATYAHGQICTLSRAVE